jgi:hypothetical protein
MGKDATMASVLSDSPTSGYVLAQWAIQYAIENHTHFAEYLSEQTHVETNPVDIVPDLEMAKSLLGELAIMTDEMMAGKLHVHVFPVDKLLG